LPTTTVHHHCGLLPGTYLKVEAICETVYSVSADGVGRAYVVYVGRGREGQTWDVLDADFRRLLTLRSTTRDAAIARAKTILRKAHLIQG